MAGQCWPHSAAVRGATVARGVSLAGIDGARRARAGPPAMAGVRWAAPVGCASSVADLWWPSSGQLGGAATAVWGRWPAPRNAPATGSPRRVRPELLATTARASMACCGSGSLAPHHAIRPQRAASHPRASPHHLGSCPSPAARFQPLFRAATAGRSAAQACLRSPWRELSVRGTSSAARKSGHGKGRSFVARGACFGFARGTRVRWCHHVRPKNGSMRAVTPPVASGRHHNGAQARRAQRVSLEQPRASRGSAPPSPGGRTPGPLQRRRRRRMP